MEAADGAADEAAAAALASDAELELLVWSKCIDGLPDGFDGEGALLVGHVGYVAVARAGGEETERADAPRLPGADLELCESDLQMLRLRADLTMQLRLEARLRTAALDRLLRLRAAERASTRQLEGPTGEQASDAGVEDYSPADQAEGEMVHPRTPAPRTPRPSRVSLTNLPPSHHLTTHPPPPRRHLLRWM